ncbi:AEC family transporter [Pontiella sp. NLcol2]|uniref:AEC family transporter n=2 Tax=Pontiella agarivorans TaxID=3038953 RepID=A0ABU5N0A0_9BACT|nr:AEC family transporter [Pontiella agarivorans]
MFILNSIAPIFLLILLGKTLQKTGFMPEVFFKSLSRFVFWFALPSLLISSISRADLNFPTISRILGIFSLGTVLSLAFAWGVAKVLKLPAPKTGAFIQGSFRGNGAFVGLPVIVYSLGSIDASAEQLATVVLAPVVVIFNILAVTVLLHYGKDKHSTGDSISTFFLQMVKNPLIMSCVTGIALNLLKLELPLFLNRSLEALGRAALPMILMSIGASLAVEKLKGAASPSLIASLIKVAVTPAIGFLLAGFFDLSVTEKMIAIFFLGCPTAGMSYVMADVMGSDSTLAARIIALSTLLSAITLPVIIAVGL